MNRCKKYGSLFAEALYEELSKEQHQELMDHLNECSRCAAEYSQLKATLQNMNQLQHPKLKSEYWDAYWQKFEHKVKETQASTNPIADWFKKRMPDFRFEVKWGYQAAAAVAIFMIGIFIGRVFLSSEDMPVRTTDTAKQHLKGDTKQASLAAQTSDYLNKSKVLLLGLVNFDPAVDDPDAIDFSYQKQVSRELVDEAHQLKVDLKDNRQQRLYNLISDLEMILLQIANFEEEYDLSSKEIIESGVDKKGILLKINIEQMRRAAEKSGSNLNKDRDRRTIL